MAASTSRDAEAFYAHWAKILEDESVWKKTVHFDGSVAGNVVSWQQDRIRLVGYWIGQDHWAKGVATQALTQFLELFPMRPLYANVARHNVGSIRVLEKCGFTLCGDERASSGTPDDEVEELHFELTTNALGEVD